LHYFVKNHGRAYAFAATLAHLAGGVLWRGRLLIQHKDPGDPPYYLADLTAHHLRAAWRRLLSAAQFPRKTRPLI
jgi:N-acetylglucosaminyl-diphospho-decaprenol L-rhamnosyltransferase